MKKMMVVFLSIILAFGCLGLSGCAGLDDIGKNKTMIEKLEDKLNDETFTSAIDYKGGLKINLSATENDEPISMSIIAKKTAQSVALMAEANVEGENEKVYIIDGFTIEPSIDNPLEYQAAEYLSLKTPLFGLLDGFMGDGVNIIDTNGIVGAEFSIIDGGYTLTKHMEVNGILSRATYTFNSDFKITNVEKLVYNSSIKTQITIEYGAQKFDIPAAVLAVKLDTQDLQANKICGDISVAFAKSGYLASVGGIKIDMKTVVNGQEAGQTTTISQSMSIKNNEFVMTTDTSWQYASGSNLYSGKINNEGAFDVDYEYDSLNASRINSIMMALVSQILNVDAIDHGGDISVVTTGKNVKISCGENYIDIKDGKIVKVYFKKAMGSGSQVENTMTLTYGVTIVAPQGVKDYVKTDYDNAGIAAYERLKNINLTNIRKEKGLKLVVTDTIVEEATATIIIDFAKYYDQTKIDLKVGEQTSVLYQYKTNIYELINENVVESAAIDTYDIIALENYLGMIWSQDEITVTDTQVIFSNNDKTEVTTIDIVKGGLITKVENKTPEGTKTITYAYGAQTVEVPQQIIDEVNKIFG